MGARTIEELESETGLAARQVRYLIAEGIVPAPTGGRAHARYGDDHVAAIWRFKYLRDLGFPPSAIKLLLVSEQGVPVAVEPGVTLLLDPKLIGSRRFSDPMAERLVDALREALKDPVYVER